MTIVSELVKCFKYPLIFGGYTGDFIIKDFDLDSSDGICIIGQSYDTTLTSRIPQYVVAYVSSVDNNVFNWVVGLPTYVDNLEVYNLQMNQGYDRVFIIFESGSFIVLSLSGNGAITCSIPLSLGDTLVAYLYTNYAYIYYYENSSTWILSCDVTVPYCNKARYTDLGSKVATAVIVLQDIEIIALKSDGSDDNYIRLQEQSTDVSTLQSLLPSYVVPYIRYFGNGLSSQDAHIHGCAEGKYNDADKQFFKVYSYGSTQFSNASYSVSLSDMYSAFCIGVSGNNSYETYLFYYVLTNSSTYYIMAVYILSSNDDSSIQSYSFFILNYTPGTQTPRAMLSSSGNYYFFSHIINGLLSEAQVTNSYAQGFLYTYDPSLLYTSNNPTNNNDSWLDSDSITQQNANYFTTSFDGISSYTITQNSETVSSITQYSSTSLNDITCTLEFWSSTISLTYYVTDTQTLDVSSNLCDTWGGCIYTYLEIDPSLSFSYTLDQTAYTFTSDDESSHGTIFDLNVYYYHTGTLYSSCSLFAKLYEVTMKYIYITQTETETSYSYSIYDPPDDGSISFSVFDHSETVTENKFNIEYQLVPISGFLDILAIYSSNQILTFSTSDKTYEGQYHYQVQASFYSYNPGYYVSYDVYIDILHPCRDAILTPDTIQDQHYFITDPLLSFYMNEWTLDITKCGTINYSTSSSISIPDFYSFDTASLLIEIQTDDIEVQGCLNIDETVCFYLNFDIYAYIPIFQDPQMEDQFYYTGNEMKQIKISSFLTSNPTTTMINYYASYTNGTDIENKIFSFSDSDMIFTIETDDLDNIGQYEIMITAKFTFSSIYYQTITFYIYILSGCLLNEVQKAYLQDQQYYISDPTLAFSINSWTYSLSHCGPIIYTALLEDGSVLPDFIQFDSDLKLFQIYTEETNYADTYKILVKGTTSEYNELLSETTQTFTLTVSCKSGLEQQLEPGDSYFTETFYKNQLNTLSVQISEFQFVPNCYPEDITYKATYQDWGNELPSFITFDSTSRIFTINDDDALNQDSYTLKVIGETDSGLAASLIWDLQIISVFDSNGDPIIQPGDTIFPEINKEVKNYEQITIKSYDFKYYTQNDYIIFIDNSADFITVQDDTIVVYASHKDVGNYTCYFFVEDESSNNIWQYINLQVIYDEALKNLNIYKSITAYISKISRMGLVEILFNQQLIVDSHLNLTQINETILHLSIFDSDRYIKNVNFAWSTEKFDDYSMQVQLYFENPLEISQNVKLVLYYLLYRNMIYFKYSF